MTLHETRQRIVDYLKEKGEASVDELAGTVGLTPMAVRYHLNVLQGDNLISAPAVQRTEGRGRPRQMYRLTEAADELFPVGYYELTDCLLGELRSRLGCEGVNDLFNSIACRLAQEAPPVKENQTLEDRLDEVIAFLEKKGFVADWEVQAESYLIHAYSCPYRQLARQHEQICLLDKHIIGTMLNATPDRIACLATGNHHCTYEVSKAIQLMGNTD
jgi:predicted ArsR family transcriptional regulator